MAHRTFTDTEAVRSRVPLMIGLYGPSGSGKTYSALRLATGIQRIVGGEIQLIDTEARRGLHYASRFKYRHQPFEPPFSPYDYQCAFEHACSRKEVTVAICDSGSHEHEGVGGVLEMHDEEWKRLGGAGKDKLSAWGPPKAARQKLVHALLQMPIVSIFCFRAKEKVKPQGGKVIQQGWMPIAGQELIYEMTVMPLLLPNAGGVPTWRSSEPGEHGVLKFPEQFRDLFATPEPLSEDHGEALARWASGMASKAVEIEQAIRAAEDTAALDAIAKRIADAKDARSLNGAEVKGLRVAWVTRRDALALAAAGEQAAAATPPEAA